MAYGLKCWDAAGNVTFDSTVYKLGSYAGAHAGIVGQTKVISFPEAAGRTVKVTQSFGLITSAPIISYASGYPVITLPAASPGKVSTSVMGSTLMPPGATWQVFIL
jgi:hypothetical protein